MLKFIATDKLVKGIDLLKAIQTGEQIIEPEESVRYEEAWGADPENHGGLFIYAPMMDIDEENAPDLLWESMTLQSPVYIFSQDLEDAEQAAAVLNEEFLGELHDIAKQSSFDQIEDAGYSDSVMEYVLTVKRTGKAPAVKPHTAKKELNEVKEEAKKQIEKEVAKLDQKLNNSKEEVKMTTTKTQTGVETMMNGEMAALMEKFMKQQATTVTKEEPKKEAPAKKEEKKEEAPKKRLRVSEPTKKEGTKKEEKEMKRTATKKDEVKTTGRRSSTKGTGTPERKAPVQKRTRLDHLFSKVERVQKFDGEWYFNTKWYPEVLHGEELVEAGMANPELGIEQVRIYDPADFKKNPSASQLAVIQVDLGGATFNFDIFESFQDDKEGVWSPQIHWVKGKDGKGGYRTYAFSRLEDKLSVEFEEGGETVTEEIGGQKWVKQPVYGIRFNEAVFAQVMSFAHYAFGFEMPGEEA